MYLDEGGLEVFIDIDIMLINKDFVMVIVIFDERDIVYDVS